MLQNKQKNGHKPINILFSYEKGRGGETITIENVLQEFNKKENLVVERIIYPTQIHFGLINNTLYIIKTLLIYLSNTYNKHYDWNITPTYTSILFFNLIGKIRRSKCKIAWYYQGNRLLFESINPNQNIIRHLSQYIANKTTKYLHSIALKNVSLIIAPSKYSKRFILSKFPFSRKVKIIVAYNGVCIDKYHPLANKSKINIKLNIAKNSKVISYIGRLDPTKGIINLINAFNLIVHANKYQNIYLIISYNRIIFQEEIVFLKIIIRLLSKYHITDKVKLIENYSNLNDIYNISDLVILPTQADNFPLVIPEAFASGTVVIASDIGGIKEILEKIDERLILLDIIPSNLVIKIDYFLNLSEPQLRKIIGKGLNVIKEHYTWKRTANTILDNLNS